MLHHWRDYWGANCCTTSATGEFQCLDASQRLVHTLDYKKVVCCRQIILTFCLKANKVLRVWYQVLFYSFLCALSILCPSLCPSRYKLQSAGICMVVNTTWIDFRWLSLILHFFVQVFMESRLQSFSRVFSWFIDCKNCCVLCKSCHQVVWTCRNVTSI